MSYVLWRFATTDLPGYNAESDISTGEVENLVIRVPGGSYDAQGATQAVQLPGTVTKRFLLFYEDDPGSAADVRELFNSFRALIGKRDRLYRRWGDERVEWVWARCTKVSGIRQPRHHFVDVTIEFERLSPVWYGHAHMGAWLLDSGIYLDSGYYLDEAELQVNLAPGDVATLELPNEGNAYVDNAEIKVTAQGSSITNIAVYALEAVNSFTFSGTIATGSGNALTVDCGRQSVNAPSAAYDDFESDYEKWFRVAPGGDEVEFYAIGGNTSSTARVRYFEAWQ